MVATAAKTAKKMQIIFGCVLIDCVVCIDGENEITEVTATATSVMISNDINFVAYMKLTEFI